MSKLHPQQTLVLDVGETIIGVYSVEQRRHACYMYDRRVRGLERLSRAKEIITYNGDEYDIHQLGALASRFGSEFKFSGVHTDMRTVCWSADIWGKSLKDTYKQQFGKPLVTPDTYEGHNRGDVRMTYALWKAWRQGTLRILDGQQT